MDDIIQGVVDALWDLYDGAVPIYTEQQKQGFEAPCFFVELINTSMERETGKRFQETASVQVSYFPPGTDGDSPDYKDIQSQIRPILLALEVIPVSGTKGIRGTDIEAAVVDDVLHVTVTYSRFIYLKGEDVPYMETLSINQKTGG
jgi:hypothetical protein